VAPLLQKRCLGCHDDVKKRGGLDLSTRGAALAGGDSGPALVAGSAARSRLVEFVSGPKPRMPRRGAKLAPSEVVLLKRWIDAGAPWPKDVVLKAEGAPAEAVWWSLRPLARPVVPAVQGKDRVRGPVDAFLLAALGAKGLSFAPEADRHTLIRRLTFDLHGLPPAPEAVEAFIRDPRADAYERLVDRLLASPRYGERWGRHWLDVAHYGDTHGYDKDKRRDHAWPYRDWVIRALNTDMPYERFVKEQIAGDVLRPGDPEGVIATGFVVAGPWDFVGHVELREGTVDKEKTRLLDRDDMVSSTITTFLSLTVACARCHDHKFDPIPQKDYYRLQAVFAGVERGDRRVEDARSRPERQRLLAERARLAGLGEKRDQTDARLRTIDARLKVLSAGVPVYAAMPIRPRPIWVLRRGDVEQRRAAVTPGGIACVPGPSPDFALARAEDEGARRAALANWIADPRNPLTWRSIVNRAWHYHFSKGIVDTPSDFGRNGSLPSHPELLDWLAIEFRDGGGSLKKLHRLIVTSTAYRQSSRHDPAAAKIDNDNRLLWRMNRRRLDAESVRDAVLATSGQLDLTMGGPGYALFRFKDDHSPVYDHEDQGKVHDPATYRRTVYRFTVRSVPNPFLDCMDCADPNINTPVRNTTLTALQALALLNNPFMVRQASHFATRLRAHSDHTAAQIDRAYRLALGRPPSAAERALVGAHARAHGLLAACRVLLNCNEFVFVD
jgi:hypothetical protein